VTETQPVKRGSTRTKARKRALDLLFEADLRELPAEEVLAAHTEQAEPAVRPFTATLVSGVVEHRDELDALIAAQLPDGWTLERMPRVDRNLARLAVFELTHTDTDAAVVLAEAVGLAGELSTDDSPSFLNGVLGSVSRSLLSHLA
jgi:transcription antitermination protein NusB